MDRIITRMKILITLSVILGKGLGNLHKVDPRQNMWVTWANETGQDSFCLSLATPSDPFRTCLIGVPLKNMKGFGPWTTAKIYDDLNQAKTDFCTIRSGSIPSNWCDTLNISINPLGAQTHSIIKKLNVTGIEP